VRLVRACAAGGPRPPAAAITTQPTRPEDEARPRLAVVQGNCGLDLAIQAIENLRPVVATNPAPRCGSLSPGATSRRGRSKRAKRSSIGLPECSTASAHAGEEKREARSAGLREPSYSASRIDVAHPRMEVAHLSDRRRPPLGSKEATSRIEVPHLSDRSRSPLGSKEATSRIEVPHLSDRSRSPLGSKEATSRTEVPHLSDRSRSPLGPK
jgi:hypothetical protein